MAFAAEFEGKFTDILQLDWIIDIEENDFAGSIEKMELAGKPLKIDFLAPSDELTWNPIHGSKADITVNSLVNFKFASLYTLSINQFKVKIYYANTSNLYWQGYILPGNYNEPYNGVPYPVTISASDGLGLLKNIPYNITDATETEPAVYYSGRILFSQIILDILSKIGHSGFTEFINIYEANMNSAVDDSPLDQSSIDAENYQDWNCYEVLSEILNKYNAVIRQKNGQFIIYRPVDLKSATVYGRIFSGSFKTSTTSTPSQLFSRTTGITDLRDVEGGNLNVINPLREIKINQFYGYRDSWIDVWQFQSKDYNLNTQKFRGWTYKDNLGLPKFSSAVASEKDGLCLINSYTTPAAPYLYVLRSFGFYAKVTADVFGFSFSYWHWNPIEIPTTEDFTIYIKIKSDSADKWLKIKDDKELEWSDTLAYITFTETVPYQNSGWKSFSRTFGGLPESGSYTITIYSCDANPSTASGFKDFKFYATSDELDVIKYRESYFPWVWKNRERRTYYDFEEVVNEEIREVDSTLERCESKDLTIYTGDVVRPEIDNILQQFRGAISINTRGTRAEAAAAFIDDHAASFLPVVADHSSEYISFIGSSNFVSAAISNLTGNLSGSVTHVLPFIPTYNKIVRLYPTNDSGQIDITCNGGEKSMTFDTNEETTCSNFVSANSGYYNGLGITLTYGESTQWYIQFEGALDFVTSYEVITPYFDCSIEVMQEYSLGQDKIDSIHLSGDNGTANISCNGITAAIEISEDLIPSVAWNSRGGSENEKLLRIICQEIKAQFSRSKQTLQGLPIIENDTITKNPQINLIGNFQDPLNKYSGNNRIFALNRASFDVREREWNIDLIEII